MERVVPKRNSVFPQKMALLVIVFIVSKMNEVKFLIAFVLIPAMALSQRPLYKFKTVEPHPIEFHENIEEIILYPGIAIERIFPDTNYSPAPWDTIYRSYLQIDKKVMIDSLFFTNTSEFAMNFNILYVYPIRRKKELFIVLECFDGFQMGSDSQPMYLILKKNNASYKLQAAYMITNIEDNSCRIPNSVKVCFFRKKLFLRGKNLILMKRF